jgi:hypothetical protein
MEVARTYLGANALGACTQSQSLDLHADRFHATMQDDFDRGRRSAEGGGGGEFHSSLHERPSDARALLCLLHVLSIKHPGLSSSPPVERRTPHLGTYFLY